VSITGEVIHALDGCNNGKMSSEDGTGRCVPMVVNARQDPIDSGVAQPIDTDGCSQAVLQCQGTNVGAVELPHLRSGNGHITGGVPAIQEKHAVRRLTPRECERLQGFPDDFTKIPWRGKPADVCPDGPRYKALGNSMAVPVMRWIGERIDMVRRGIDTALDEDV